MRTIKVLLVEDNRLLREGLAAILGKQPDFNVASTIGNGEKIVSRVRSSKPHVVLLDLGLRSQNSLEIVRTITSDFPDVRTIVMDLVPLESDIVAFMKAGASGFLLKDASTKDFLTAIRSVAQGKKVLPSLLTDSLFSQIANHAVTSDRQSKLSQAVRMTKRERQVIALVAEDLTNKEIADKLHLSSFTVKSHIHNILEKLALRSRFQLAKYLQDSRVATESISLIDA